MINMGPELDDIERYIWKARAFLGRDQFDLASDHIMAPSYACDAIAKLSNHMSLEELKRLKDLSQQCCDIVVYINKQENK